MRRIELKPVSIATLLLFSLCFALSLLAPKVMHAQSFLSGDNGLRLILSPQFPVPHSEVTVSVDDYSIETLGSTITWYVDGKEIKEVTNERAITVTTGALGKKSEVRVLVTNAKSPAFSATQSISPTVVDVTLESDTYVPSFYKGRALPSRESSVKALAVVHDDTTLPDSRYTFKWTLNDAVLHGGPVTGKSSTNFTMPRYDGGRLTVEVFNTDSVLVGKRTLVLNPTELEMHFYENSPLRGLSQKEIRDTYALTREEVTIYGEPYFMNTNIISPSLADVVWEINGEKVQSSTEAPNTITLKRVGESGSAQVSCSIVTKTRIPQFVRGTFQAFFQ
jgi:hypothetical protein